MWIILAAFVVGYLVGVIQKGVTVNINDKRENTVDFDKEGNPIYNESYNTLSKDLKEWIERRDQ